MNKQEQIKELEDLLDILKDEVSFAYQEEARVVKLRTEAERAVTEAQLKLDALRDEELENESGRLSYNDKAQS